MVGLIQSSATLATSASTLSLGGGGHGGTSPSRAPFRKVLTKNRSYLETGTLSYDEAVVTYLAKLDEHRKKCEVDGRYQEARAAALRLADLKTAQVGGGGVPRPGVSDAARRRRATCTHAAAAARVGAQVERLRLELVANQGREIEEVHRVFEEENKKFSAMWDERVKEFEATFHKAVDDLREMQEAQRRQYVEDLLRKKPFKPKPSRVREFSHCGRKKTTRPARPAPLERRCSLCLVRLWCARAGVPQPEED